LRKKTGEHNFVGIQRSRGMKGKEWERKEKLPRKKTGGNQKG